MKPIRTKPLDASGRNWLLPFNDMMTLLLTFFVLMLSISKVDTSKVQTASFAVSEHLGVAVVAERVAVRLFDPFVFSEDSKEGAAPEEQAPVVQPWGSLEDREKFVKLMNGMAGVRARMTESGSIEASFNEDLFYRSSEAQAGAEPSTKEHPGLQELISVLGRSDAMVRVEDHTNNAPADKTRFASHYELSTARAARFAAVLMEKGISPRRISIAGYGDLRALLPGGLKAGKLSNRIEFVIIFNQA